MLTRELQAEVSKPFPVDVIEFKPTNISKDGTKATPLAFVDLRHYYDRLDEVVGPGNWNAPPPSVVVNSNLVVPVVSVCVFGIPYSDVSEEKITERSANEATSPYARAFKRACSKFGLGRYLWNLPYEHIAFENKKFVEGNLSIAIRMYNKLGLPVPEHTPKSSSTGQQDSRTPSQPKDIISRPTLSDKQQGVLKNYGFSHEEIATIMRNFDYATAKSIVDKCFQKEYIGEIRKLYGLGIFSEDGEDDNPF